MPSADDARPPRPPVPGWDELPDYAQADLASREYDADWFARQKDDPALRLTVLALYVKLRGMDLWRFVSTEAGTQIGRLHFHCAEIDGLRAALSAHPDFTDPEGPEAEWSCRERRERGALHFKHFAGWPPSKVQAHIDPEGLHLHNQAWWLVPVIPLSQMLAHAADKEGYADVQVVRDLLLAQGWDPAPLIGKG